MGTGASCAGVGDAGLPSRTDGTSVFAARPVMPARPKVTKYYAFAGIMVAMTRRIQLVLNKCVDCSETDRFIAAVLAENGPGFTQKNMSEVLAKYGSRTGDVVNINWERYLQNVPGRTPNIRELIRDFARNIAILKHQRWRVPKVNWNIINKLGRAE